LALVFFILLALCLFFYIFPCP